jgi:glycosyltransferase involved in cell wall biosynthesis
MTRYSLLSTYPPTRCGLATFSESLAAALTASPDDSVQIVRAVDDLDGPTPARVGDRVSIVGELHVNRPAGAGTVARLLSSDDVVIVQHEYGIYGGDDGDDVLRVLEALTAPSIVVLHTVLEDPTPHQRRVLEQVAASATAVVVMSDTARALLAAGYRIDMHRVSVIPHGVPEWDSLVGTHRRDRTTMLTWGLIGPGKGLEWGIRAVAELRDLAPALHYEILGETHPKVIAHEGEAYRDRLRLLAEDLGVADRVTFDARYLDRVGLAARVGAADLVLLPYDSREQVTSGVLVEAVAAGKPVVATSFPHAIELLSDGAGTIVAHESPAAIADAVRGILNSASATSHSRPVAFDPGTTWSSVAQRYRELAETMASSIARTA